MQGTLISRQMDGFIAITGKINSNIYIYIFLFFYFLFFPPSFSFK